MLSIACCQRARLDLALNFVLLSICPILRTRDVLDDQPMYFPTRIDSISQWRVPGLRIWQVEAVLHVTDAQHLLDRT